MKDLHNQMHYFFKTKNWKNYWVNSLKKNISGKVIDVGSGFGSNVSFYLKIKKIKNLICLEPNKFLFKKLRNNKSINKKKVIFKNKTLLKVKSKNEFDTIIYADVLEHIKNDYKEIKTAINSLKFGGKLIILCPSHNYLYTEFDKNVGHFRRYNKKMFKKLKLSNTEIVRIYYLDSCGFFLSLMNKWFLKRNPKKNEIKFWDERIVPISRFLDPLLLNSFGKTIVCIYKKVNL